MSWRTVLRGDPLPWLLERDPFNPGVRYFALLHLLDCGPDDAEVRKAKADVMSSGPVRVILDAQSPEGYWRKPGPGYSPKFRGTVWQLIFLAQLGADISEPRVRKGCEYLLENVTADHGGFSYNQASAGFIHCLAGNLGAALVDLGLRDDDRVLRSIEFQARMITGRGVAGASSRETTHKYYRSGTTGSTFACAYNGGLPCAWGGVKAMMALGKVPSSHLTPAMQAAIKQGVEFLLSRDPAIADYPFRPGSRISPRWFQFEFPVGYVADVLQNLEVLAKLGHIKDPRLSNAINMVLSKQDEQGRWKLGYSYNGKAWADFEKRGLPSKWVTLRALKVLKAAFPE